jgi:5-methylcytosine-specific restriction protein A
MPIRSPIYRPIGQSNRQRAKAYDQARSKDEARKWYRTAAWQDMRQRQLRDAPLCQSRDETLVQRSCGAIATDVDHRRPHRGDRGLFFDPDNLQSLCKSCHSRKTRLEGGARA